jgi:hypothetical protein
MSDHPKSVDQAIARFEEVMGRIDRTGSSASREANRRQVQRNVATVARKATNIGIALGVVLLGAIVAGIVLNGIGLTGLFIVFALMFLSVIFFSVWGGSEKPVVSYRDDLPNKAVVQGLDTLLVRKRAALPAPAASRLDAISAQLPLLENRLAETAVLDPLAQDARRLMGKHLPELIERYERVPAQYRRDRDGEGLTVDDRLVQGLDAARTALDDLGRKLAREDLDAFQTQGRFIESRYKDNDTIKSE